MLEVSRGSYVTTNFISTFTFSRWLILIYTNSKKERAVNHWRYSVKVVLPRHNASIIIFFLYRLDFRLPDRNCIVCLRDGVTVWQDVHDSESIYFSEGTIPVVYSSFFFKNVMLWRHSLKCCNGVISVCMCKGTGSFSWHDRQANMCLFWLSLPCFELCHCRVSKTVR